MNRNINRDLIGEALYRRASSPPTRGKLTREKVTVVYISPLLSLRRIVVCAETRCSQLINQLPRLACHPRNASWIVMNGDKSLIKSVLRIAEILGNPLQTPQIEADDSHQPRLALSSNSCIAYKLANFVRQRLLAKAVLLVIDVMT